MRLYIVEAKCKKVKQKLISNQNNHLRRFHKLLKNVFFLIKN